MHVCVCVIVQFYFIELKEFDEIKPNEISHI